MDKHNNCNTGCNALMRRIRALDFAIQETVLYLDAYPDCAEALEHYHKLVCERNTAVAEYEQQCGPVTIFGNTSTSKWQWINGPWPWHYDAN
ncbi:MAG: spore coat protein CotJB [Clostridia bacterium]|nr:spore coat protein CotJB [Clostridia bacterium]